MAILLSCHQFSRRAWKEDSKNNICVCCRKTAGGYYNAFNINVSSKRTLAQLGYYFYSIYY